MAPSILLVDDQRNILHLLHSTLNTMGHDLEIIEAPSGEEAMLTATRRRIDLLVVDYRLPGITGIELIHKIRSRHPSVKVIIVSGLHDKKARDEMLNAGAVAVFEKPVPLGDFIDVVERSLGLERMIFPPADEQTGSRQSRLSELLVNFRQDLDANGVFLLNDHGLVLARAGALRDSSMEVSLISALMAIYTAALKVSRFARQEQLSNFHVFSGGDQDLIFIPVDSSYSLLLAGQGLADRDRVLDTVQAMLALRENVEQALTHLGVTGPLVLPEEQAEGPHAPAKKVQEQAGELPISPEMEDLLKQAEKKTKAEDVNDFWERAAQQHGQVSANPDVISYDQARKMGLLPGEDK